MQNGVEDCGGNAPIELSALRKEGIKNLLDSVDSFIFDCDGVIWLADQILPASAKLIALLRKMGKKVFFITNNSLFSQERMLAKFNRAGIDVSKDEIVFPALLLCHHLQKIEFKGKIEILGEAALKDEVRAKGFDVNDNELASKFINGEKEFRTASVVVEPISAVVVDVDMNASFVKITRVLDILKNPDCLFFAGCTDKKLPVTATLNTAGPGYLLAVIKDLTGRVPQVLGKPSTGMFDMIKEKLSIDPKRTIFIGDSIENDIQMSKNCGLRSILVFTGCAKRENIPYNDPTRTPNYVSESLAEILSFVEKL